MPNESDHLLEVSEVAEPPSGVYVEALSCCSENSALPLSNYSPQGHPQSSAVRLHTSARHFQTYPTTVRRWACWRSDASLLNSKWPLNHALPATMAVPLRAFFVRSYLAPGVCWPEGKSNRKEKPCRTKRGKREGLQLPNCPSALVAAHFQTRLSQSLIDLYIVTSEIQLSQPWLGKWLYRRLVSHGLGISVWPFCKRPCNSSSSAKGRLEGSLCRRPATQTNASLKRSAVDTQVPC